MKISIISLFPQILAPYFETSIMKRACEAGHIQYELLQLRDYSERAHKKVDDEIYGGGPGMLLDVACIDAALKELISRSAGRSTVRIIFPSPSGRLFNAAYAHNLAREQHLVFVCGHYEGYDQRALDLWADDEISLGDYVISSGEVAALVLIDAIFRLVPGVILPASLEEESFASGQAQGALEYPQFTRPQRYANLSVPPELLSGHHKNITTWRLAESLKKTLAYRPDLVDGLSPELQALVKKLTKEES